MPELRGHTCNWINIALSSREKCAGMYPGAEFMQTGEFRTGSGIVLDPGTTDEDVRRIRQAEVS